MTNSRTRRGCDFLNVAQSLRDWDFERHSFSGDFRVFDESRRLGISVAERLSYKNSQPRSVGEGESASDSTSRKRPLPCVLERSPSLTLGVSYRRPAWR
jgi:hypothetical protein